MKKWMDIPEYKQIFEGICNEGWRIEEVEKRLKAEYAKQHNMTIEDVNCGKCLFIEQSKEIEAIKREWWDRLHNVTVAYRKEHPEEFDDNGNFKL